MKHLGEEKGSSWDTHEDSKKKKPFFDIRDVRFGHQN